MQDLECLKGSARLQSLNLGRTNVTDSGLEHLKGLTDLRSLNLDWTKVAMPG